MPLTFNVSGSATFGGTYTPTPPSEDSSEEPDWAWHINNEAGITSDAGVVSAIADQSGYANNTSAIVGVSISTTTFAGGAGVLEFAGSSSYAKFSSIVAQDQRTELANGWAFVICARIADGEYNHRLVHQGRYGGAIRYTGGQYSNRSEFKNGDGGGNIGLDTDESSWAFRYVSVNTTGGTLNIGVGKKGAFARGITLAGVNVGNTDPAYPLLLGNAYNENTGAIQLDGTVMSVRAAGIINATQVERCRRYWAARYSLAL